MKPTTLNLTLTALAITTACGLATPAHAQNPTPPTTPPSTPTLNESRGGASEASGTPAPLTPTLNESRGGASEASGTTPRNLPAPPGLSDANLTPLTGEALDRARTPLADVAKSKNIVVPEPPEADPPDAEDDPPLAAQRSYAAGREAWRDGKSFDAVTKLQAALRLAPDRPEILQLLGQIYMAQNNRPRGAFFLRQALDKDPNDLPTRLMLGRYALETGDADAALTHLYTTLELARNHPDAVEEDPAIVALADYFLAATLQQMGHAQASAEAYRAYLDAPRVFTRLTTTARELAFLDAQQGRSLQALGDLLHQLDRPEDALEAYQDAARQNPPDPHGLAKRLVYTLLRLGRDDEAARAAADRVEAADSDPASLELLAYVAQHASGSDALIQSLKQLYADRDRPATLALALARLLPPDEGRDLLIDHLESDPDAGGVFDSLLDATLDTPRAAGGTGGEHDPAADPLAKPSPEAVARAVEITSAAMDAAPERGDEYVQALVNRLNDSKALLDAVDHLPESQQQQPPVRTIRGLALAQSGHPKEALAELRAALDADADARAARLALARLLMSDGEFDQARELLEPLGADGVEAGGGGDVLSLQARALAANKKLDEALALLENINADSPVELALLKAQLQAQSDFRAAEAGLLALLERHPRNEDIYATLLQIYNANAQNPEVLRSYQRLMRQLLTQMPDSRIARLELARIQVLGGNLAEAEALVKAVLEMDERDILALVFLQEIYDKAGRKGDAVEVAQRLLQLMPEGPQRAYLQAQLYWKDLHKPLQALEVAQQALARPDFEEPAPLASLVWRITLETQGPDAAAKSLDDLIQRFPEHEADLRYELASLMERQGKRADADTQLERVLELDPEHIQASNGLSYSLAQQGKQLDRAERLVQTAIDSQPQSAAYLDTLGWVYYKQGRFGEAVEQLTKARQSVGGEYPVMLDHLGDAQFRLGRLGAARETWQDAAELLRTKEFDNDDRELEGLLERIEAKLTALNANQPVPVANLPGEEGPVPAPGVRLGGIGGGGGAAGGGANGGAAGGGRGPGVQVVEQAPPGVDQAVRDRLDRVQQDIQEAVEKVNERVEERQEKYQQDLETAKTEVERTAIMTQYNRDYARLRAEADGAAAGAIRDLLEFIEEGEHEVDPERIQQYERQAERHEAMRDNRLRLAGEEVPDTKEK